MLPPLPSPRALVSFAALALLGLSAKPIVHAQSVPLWTDQFGPIPAQSTGSAVLLGGDDAVYLAGYRDGDEDDGRVLATVARLADGDDEALAWEITVEGPGGGQLFPFGLLARGADSLTVVYLEAAPEANVDGGFGEAFGRVYLQAVALADGGSAAAVPVDFPAEAAFEGILARAIPGEGDLVIAATRRTDSREEPFLARVGVDGAVVWQTTDLKPGGPGSFFLRVVDLALLPDRLYVQGGEAEVLSLDPADGSRRGTVAFPSETGVARFGESRLYPVGDTIYWVRTSFFGSEVNIATLAADGADGSTAATFSTGQSTQQVTSPVAVRVTDERLGVVVQRSGSVEEFGFDRRGQFVGAISIDGGQLSTSPQDAPAAAAVTDGGELLLVGQFFGGRGRRNAAVGRYDLDGGTVEVSVLPGERTAELSVELLDVIERSGGGVNVLYRDEVDLFLRVLDAEGAVVDDGAVTTDALLSGYYGAAPLPNGDIVAFVALRERGIGDLTAIRFGANGIVSASRLLLSAADLLPAPDNQATRTPDGNVRFFYSVRETTTAGFEYFSQAIVLAPDLSVVAETSLPDDAGITNIAGLLPIDGSDEVIVYENTDRAAADDNYVARLTADLSDVVWRYAAVDADGDPVRLARVAVLNGGTVAALSEDLDLALLSLDDGGVTGRSGVADPPGNVLEADLRAGGEGLLLAYETETLDGDAGFFRSGLSLANVDVASGAFTPAATLPVSTSVGNRILGDGVVYREFDGRGYFGATRAFGTGRQVVVAAFAEVLTPVAEFAGASVSGAVIGPNPAAAGTTVVLRGAGPLSNEQQADGRAASPVAVYDGLGRRVARVPTGAGVRGGVTFVVPALASGLYRVVGTGAAGEVVLASLQVL